MIIQAFYNGVSQSVRFTIDAVTRGALMSKPEGEAHNLIEEMILNNVQWFPKQGHPKWVGGKLEVDALALLYAKVDPLTQRLERMNVNVVNSSAPSPYEICGSVK